MLEDILSEQQLERIADSLNVIANIMIFDLVKENFPERLDTLKEQILTVLKKHGDESE